MNRLRSLCLPMVALVATAMMVTATPAVAQDGPPRPPSEMSNGWQGSWQGQWQAPDNQVYHGTWTGTYERDVYPGSSSTQFNGPPPVPNGPGAWGAPRDEHWQRMVERCSTDHRSGKVVGGVIGGVVGGVIGNRLASGNRVLGTVAGAGIGALGGVAVGTTVDRRHDRECEDFFRGYGQSEHGYHGDWGVQSGNQSWSAPAGYIWVPIMVQGHNAGQGYTETVTTTEEIIDDGREVGGYHRSIRHRIIRRAQPRRVHDKRVYIGGS